MGVGSAVTGRWVGNNPADDTFRRRSASRGGRHQRIREDLLRVGVPDRLPPFIGGQWRTSSPDPIQVCPPNPGGQGALSAGLLVYR